MARFRLELGPVPLHHQVYLDLRRALDAGEWRPGDQLPTGARAGRPVRLQPDHGPARARASSPARTHRAHARSRHVRAPPADRPRHRRPLELHRPRCRQRGLDAETRLVSARPESAAAAVADGPRPGARLADPLPRAAAAGRRRAATCSSRSTCRPSGSRACSPATSSTSSLYERLATALRRPGSCAPARRSSPSSSGLGRLASWISDAGPPALLVEGIAYAADGGPVEFGRTYVRGDRSRYYVEREVDRPIRWPVGPGQVTAGEDGMRSGRQSTAPRSAAGRRSMRMRATVSGGSPSCWRCWRCSSRPAATSASSGAPSGSSAAVASTEPSAEASAGGVRRGQSGHHPAAGHRLGAAAG